MFHARLRVGAVVVRGARQSVVLEAEGDRAVIAPIVRSPGTARRGDVVVSYHELGINAGCDQDLVVRCGAARIVAVDRQVQVGGVSGGLLARLRKAVVRARESEIAEASGEIRCTLMAAAFISFGRRIGRAGTG